MKRREVIKRITTKAKAHSVSWTLLRQGANHEVWDLDGVMVPIPRHSELGNRVAEMIWTECEARRGEDWWR
ncbi:MAG: hypothetical protein ACRCSN_08000 [Dermatophilaceae bacterium]